MYQQLVDRFCVTPDVCDGHCKCIDFSRRLFNTQSTWVPYTGCETVYRDLTVPHHTASYRKNEEADGLLITAEDVTDSASKCIKDPVERMLRVRAKHKLKQRDVVNKTIKIPADILPIAVQLELDKTIPPEYWDTNSTVKEVTPLMIGCISGYNQLDFTNPKHHWETVVHKNNPIDPDAKLPLFFTKYNPLSIVLQLLVLTSIKEDNSAAYVILEYIFQVCLQFYAVCNGRWMIKSSDNDTFSEQNSEYILMTIQSYDFAQSSYVTIEDCYTTASSCSFTTFFRSVVHHLHGCNELFSQYITMNTISQFFEGKMLGANSYQTLETTHWVIHPVKNMDLAVKESRSIVNLSKYGGKNHVTQWCGSTGVKMGKMQTYKLQVDADVARVPLFFSHSFADPFTPAITLPQSVINAWRLQRERCVDILVLMLTWYRAEGKSMPDQLSEPAVQRHKSEQSETSIKIDTPYLAEQYYYNYDEMVSPVARKYTVQLPLTREYCVGELRSLVNTLNTVVAQLLVWTQKTSERVFTTGRESRTRAARWIPGYLDYTRAPNLFLETPEGWPAVPRHRHPQSMYLERISDYCMCRVYLPQLCQPTIERHRWKQYNFPFDWYPAINTITGMSYSGFRWNILRGRGIDMSSKLDAAQQYYHTYKYSMVHQWYIDSYRVNQHTCNRYIAWRALEIMLGDEALISATLYGLHYDKVEDASIRSLYNKLQIDYTQHIQQMLKQLPSNERVVSFFRLLFNHYSYTNEIIPLPEHLTTLFSTADMESIVNENFSNVEININLEPTDLREYYTLIMNREPIITHDMASSQECMVYLTMHDNTQSQTNVAVFFNWLYGSLFERCVFPAMMVWDACMPVDGIYMSNGQSWTESMLSPDDYTALINKGDYIATLLQSPGVKDNIQLLFDRILLMGTASLPDNVKDLLNTLLTPTMKLHESLHGNLYKVRRLIDQKKQQIKQRLWSNPLHVPTLIECANHLKQLIYTSDTEVAYQLAQWIQEIITVTNRQQQLPLFMSSASNTAWKGLIVDQLK